MKNKNFSSMLFAGIMTVNVIFGLYLVLNNTNSGSYDKFKSEIQLFDSYSIVKEQPSDANDTIQSSDNESTDGDKNITADDKVVQFIYNQDGTLNEYETEPHEEEVEEEFNELSPEVKKAIRDAEKIYDQEFGSGYTGMVNINMASLEMLQSLAGVGEETALNIIEHRLRIGGFTSIEQIKDVKNIGEKKFEKFKDRLKIID